MDCKSPERVKEKVGEDWEAENETKSVIPRNPVKNHFYKEGNRWKSVSISKKSC